MMPKISVVMSVNNDAEQLPETIDSVLRQSHADFEFIIVDDGSTDPITAKVLQDCQTNDARIVLISKVNQGLTAALVDACKLARGTFIARIDAGDVMNRERLSLQAQALESDPQCVFVSCYTEFHGPDWEPLWLNTGSCENTGPVKIPSDILEEDLKIDIPHHGSVMFRRATYEQAGGYRTAFYYGQDWDLWYRLAEHGRFYMLPQVLYHARFFPGSISMTNAARQRAIAECSKGAFLARLRGQDETFWLDQAAAVRPPTSVGSRQKRDTEPGYYFIGEALRRRGDPRCQTYFWNAIRSHPFALRAYVRLVQSLLNCKT